MILTYGKINSKIDILDVGCGSGGFLNRLNKSKYNRYGVEINDVAVNICKKIGLKVFKTDILNFKSSKRFDVITMWHVLEHVEHPTKVVRKINRLLKKNGIFIFAVPNSTSLGLALGKDEWFHLDSPRHLFIPNESNLRLLLQRHGFEVLKVTNEFYDNPLDLFWSVKQSMLRYLIYPLYPAVKVFDPETLTIVCKLRS